MAIDITKLENGSIEINNSALPYPQYFNNLTEIKSEIVAPNKISIITNIVTFSFNYEDIDQINSADKPEDIEDGLELLSTAVFNG